MLPIMYVGVCGCCVSLCFVSYKRDILVVIRLMLQVYCCKMTNSISCKQLYKAYVVA